MNKFLNSGMALVLVFACLADKAACEVKADLFFRDAALTHARISPDGRRQAMVLADESGFTLSLRDSDSKRVTRILDSRKLAGHQIKDLLDIEWIDNRYLALVLVEDRAAIADLIETRSRRYTYFIDVKKPPQSVDDMLVIKTSGWLAHTLPREGGRFLYAKSGINSRLYAINVSGLHPAGKQLSKTEFVDGGQFSLQNIVAEIEGYAHHWFTALDGTVVAALVTNKAKKLVLMETADSGKSWKALVEFPRKPAGKARKAKKPAPAAQKKYLHKNKGPRSKKNERRRVENQKAEPELMIPIAYAGSPGSYYAVLEQEQAPDSLYLLDYSSGSRELLYQHPTADIFQVTTSNVDYRLLSVGISNRGEPQYIYFDGGQADIFEKLKRKEYEGYLALVESDLQNRNHIIYNFRSNSPGVLLLYDEPGDSVIKLGDVVPGVPASLNSELIVEELTIDELPVEYFLSKPEGPKQGGYPLVVIPHGGPVGISDHRLYDPLTQYLVANGLAVLQVNYRGSAGYGNDYIEAGKQQWGSGMLDDIYNVLAVVKRRNDIDPGRICIAGGSYGGYAALALAIRYPQEFKCAASYAGVTDVQLLTSKPDATVALMEWFDEYIGDPETEADYLKRISPVYNAAALKVPLLIAHGTDDDRVDIEHLYRMSFALDRLNTPYEKIVLEGGGHDFESARDAAGFYSRLYAFLRKHLGQ